MKDEIKEILDKILLNCDTQEEKNKLLDYITNLQNQLQQASLDIQELTERDIECPSWCDKLTNLQEENQKLNKEKNVLLENLCMSRQKYNNDKARYRRKAKAYKEELDKIKSRNEKAINEVIRVLQIILEQPSKDKLDDLWIINKLEGIQTLLQGDDKE